MSVTHNFVSSKPPAADPTQVGSVEWNAAHTVSIADADVVVGAAIAESKLALNFATHAPVTIGTASGLSLSTQALSLGLASAGVTGALSGTDWSTFNGKQAALGFTPVDSASVNWIDLTDGGATTLHTHAGGSGDISGTGIVGQVAEFVTDTKTLQAAKLIGPASNILTITNSAASTLALAITSAKTLTLTAADNYTLTVPATGTVALLATANIFTAAQKVNVNSTTGLLIEQTGVKSNTLVIDTTNGRVGVGTGPGYVLDVNAGSVDAALRITTANGYASIFAGIWSSNWTSGCTTQFWSTSNSGNLGTSTNHIMILHANSKDYIRLDGNGNCWKRSYNDAIQLEVSGHTTQTNPIALFWDETAATAVVREIFRLRAQSSGTPAAGFGVGQGFYAETATSGTNQQQGQIATTWIDATNASRKAKMSLSAYDTAARLGIEIEADGSNPKLGFFGVATVVRPTALTTQLTAITHTAPGTPDYALQDLVDSSGGAAFGFATKDEGNTLLSVVKNLQTRVGELETKLQALGLLT